MSWDAGAGLEEKRVIITGAAGAIGSAIVRAPVYGWRTQLPR